MNHGPTESRKPSPVRTDGELVGAALEGDRQAFVEIVQRHQSLVCAVAFNVTGRLEVSEEAAQDTFVTAWRKLGELREPEKLRAWLCRIAHAHAVDRARRQKLEVSTDELEFVADSAASPDEAAANREDAALVWKALETLPEASRLPLILFYREGQSVAAVAEAMEMSEEAVRQRLSRGRAALRERMASLAESVLGATRPSAVFTFAVMAAVGALMAPAALAATAFASAAAAGSAAASTGAAVASTAPAATTTTTTSFVTAMTATKSLLAAAALAAVLVPVGYALREHNHPTTSSQKEEAVILKPAAPGLKVPSFKDSELYAEWQRLHEEHGHTADAMPALFKAISEIKDTFRRRAFRAALIAEWTELDPNAALTHFRGKKDFNNTRQVMREWMTRDASAAVSALMATGEGWQNVAKNLLDEIAKATPQMVGAIVSQLPKPDSIWDVTVKDGFAAMAGKDFALARAEAEKMTGPNRAQALSGVAAEWGSKDPQAAWDWAQSMGVEDEKNASLHAVLISWSKVDPLAALDRIDKVPPGGDMMGSNTDIGSRVLSVAAEKDFDGTMKWLKEHPGKLGYNSMNGLMNPLSKKLCADVTGTLEMLRREYPEALKSVMGNVLLNDGFNHAEEIRRWLDTQSDSEFVKGTRAALINSVSWNDPQMMMRWVNEMPPEQRTPENYKETALRLLNGGGDLERIEELIATSPPELAAAFISVGFQNGRDWPGGDVKPWLERLNQLPAKEQARGAGRIAATWAASDPEAAAEWAATLTDEEARTSSFASIAGRWAQADSYETSKWIATLPQGAERDAATQMLVQSIAGVEPDSALTWAENIKDPTTRFNAQTMALQEWARKDRAGALAQMAGLNLSKEQQAALLPALDAASSGKLPPHRPPFRR